MFAAALVVLTLSSPLSLGDVDGLVPGDGVALDPVPAVVVPLGLPEPSDRGSRSTVPLGMGAVASVTLVGAGVVAGRRRRRSMEPLLVLVHGNGGSEASFDPLLDQLSVGSFEVVAFDWRTTTPAATSTEASKVAPTEAAAHDLDTLLRELSKDHGNIYTIHHSKGGAVGVAMIAALDDGTRPAIDGYRGAALLDPAIATGWLGAVQRFGAFSTHLPDNGGFDPVACSSDGCRDRRDHLGEASGVDVIAIRNPDAVVSNFRDQPDGLRVFDLVDDGKPSALWFSGIPLVFASRVSEAHSSVLEHWSVADCISAEVVTAGSCEWKGDSWSPRIVWGSAGSLNLMR
jgi:pimeloyl-ACP methyl ester carboxylesterase